LKRIDDKTGFLQKKTAYLSEEISLVTLAFEHGKTADE